MGSARALLLGKLRRADRHNRLRFSTPVTAGGTDIYVHAKVLVIDDTLIRVGSSNINNRSMGLDTECDLAVEARPGDTNAPALRSAILRVRDSLLAEHLGITREALRETLRAEGNSVVGALDRLRGCSAKTLIPFEPPVLSDTERELAETHLLDPRRPEGMATVFVRAVRIFAPASVAALTSVALGVGAVLSSRYRRGSARP
jgi:phospholipase D1/2